MLEIMYEMKSPVKRWSREDGDYRWMSRRLGNVAQMSERHNPSNEQKIRLNEFPECKYYFVLNIRTDQTTH